MSMFRVVGGMAGFLIGAAVPLVIGALLHAHSTNWLKLGVVSLGLGVIGAQLGSKSPLPMSPSPCRGSDP